MRGEKFESPLSGFFGRVVQHETDHLDGIMFIDRLLPSEREEIEHEIEEFRIDFQSKRDVNGIASDEEIAQHIARIESAYC